jgi:hypothetical protein
MWSVPRSVSGRRDLHGPDHPPAPDLRHLPGGFQLHRVVSDTSVKKKR